jgi:hypothetical protein
VTSSQNKPSGNFQYREDQQLVQKPKKFSPCICYNCRQPGHYANECPNPKQHKPQKQNQNPRVDKGNHDKGAGSSLRRSPAGSALPSLSCFDAKGGWLYKQSCAAAHVCTAFATSPSSAARHWSHRRHRTPPSALSRRPPTPPASPLGPLRATTATHCLALPLPRRNFHS